MFYKEIQEQTEPGSAFLEYMEAQILKISLLGAKHGDAIMGLMCILLCSKKL